MERRHVCRKRSQFKGSLWLIAALGVAAILALPHPALAQLDFTDSVAVRLVTYPVKRDGGSVVPGSDGMPRPASTRGGKPAGLNMIPTFPVHENAPGAWIIRAFRQYLKQDPVAFLGVVRALMDNGYVELHIAKRCATDVAKIQYEHLPTAEVPSFKEAGLTALMQIVADAAVAVNLGRMRYLLRDRYNAGLVIDPAGAQKAMARFYASQLGLASKYEPLVATPVLAHMPPGVVNEWFKAEVSEGKPVDGILLIGPLRVAIKALVSKKTTSPAPAGCPGGRAATRPPRPDPKARQATLRSEPQAGAEGGTPITVDYLRPISLEEARAIRKRWEETADPDHPAPHPKGSLPYNILFRGAPPRTSQGGPLPAEPLSHLFSKAPEDRERLSILRHPDDQGGALALSWLTGPSIALADEGESPDARSTRLLIQMLIQNFTQMIEYLEHLLDEVDLTPEQKEAVEANLNHFRHMRAAYSGKAEEARNELRNDLRRSGLDESADYLQQFIIEKKDDGQLRDQPQPKKAKDKKTAEERLKTIRTKLQKSQPVSDQERSDFEQWTWQRINKAAEATWSEKKHVLGKKGEQHGKGVAYSWEIQEFRRDLTLLYGKDKADKIIREFITIDIDAKAKKKKTWTQKELSETLQKHGVSKSAAETGSQIFAPEKPKTTTQKTTTTSQAPLPIFGPGAMTWTGIGAGPGGIGLAGPGDPFPGGGVAAQTREDPDSYFWRVTSESWINSYNTVTQDQLDNINRSRQKDGLPPLNMSELKWEISKVIHSIMKYRHARGWVSDKDLFIWEQAATNSRITPEAAEELWETKKKYGFTPLGMASPVGFGANMIGIGAGVGFGWLGPTSIGALIGPFWGGVPPGLPGPKPKKKPDSIVDEIGDPFKSMHQQYVKDREGRLAAIKKKLESGQTVSEHERWYFEYWTWVKINKADEGTWAEKKYVLWKKGTQHGKGVAYGWGIQDLQRDLILLYGKEKTVKLIREFETVGVGGKRKVTWTQKDIFEILRKYKVSKLAAEAGSQIFAPEKPKTATEKKKTSAQKTTKTSQAPSIFGPGAQTWTGIGAGTGFGLASWGDPWSTSGSALVPANERYLRTGGTSMSSPASAGVAALVTSQGANSTVTERLRQAGAVILGKSNLSEWANFRGLGNGQRVVVSGPGVAPGSVHPQRGGIASGYITIDNRRGHAVLLRPGRQPRQRRSHSWAVPPRGIHVLRTVRRGWLTQSQQLGRLLRRDHRAGPKIPGGHHPQRSPLRRQRLVGPVLRQPMGPPERRLYGPRRQGQRLAHHHGHGALSGGGSHRYGHRPHPPRHPHRQRLVQHQGDPR
jgi:hypothetical protein